MTPSEAFREAARIAHQVGERMQRTQDFRSTPQMTVAAQIYDAIETELIERAEKEAKDEKAIVRDKEWAFHVEGELRFRNKEP